MLRQNQKDAIKTSIDNDFKSGIHYHATGSGKSWIAMTLLDEYNKRYPTNNVLWICERKDILEQQFSKEILKERGFSSVLKNYNVCDFVNSKSNIWYEALNASSFWGKPYLCIINRCFLTSKEKYKYIKKSIDLIIHDECHSIENKTTTDFYKWIDEYKKSKVIGFSATPEYKYPLDHILTKYSMYDAFLDKVIVPPKIVWIKSENDPTTIDLVSMIKYEVNKLNYKKIIVWCGIIEECIEIANLWSTHFRNFKICVDYNGINTESLLFADYKTFYNLKENGILFCAVKHREGSDIPNLDGCIFMDMVEKRSNRVFIQCMGRVLRKDKLNKKKYGLIIDIKAKSTISLCNRIHHYLRLKDIFPWKYSNIKFTTKNNSNDTNVYFINYLKMIKVNVMDSKLLEKQLLKTDYSKDEIISYFKREIPQYPNYLKRLDKEIKLIIKKKLFGNIIRAIEILEMTKDIPHVTRGSCGSSLICYLLGISHIDPVKYKISFARFLNDYRDNLPDIDFDFPHYLRDEVFLKLFQKWGNKVARISNHIYYHEKSALRESLRKNGIHKFISKYDINKEINSYDYNLKNSIYKTQKELEGKFKGYSLHCGGIVYYPKGIPEMYLLNQNNESILPQINLNKVDIAENKNFKIDILSSRGLSQLYYINSFKSIDFNAHIGDPKTIELLSSGNNIGLTLAETPLMRKAMLLIKPKSICDLAICLSIIRPAAKDAKKEFELGTYSKDSLIYDDDVIFIIAELLNCNEEYADKLRRAYCKGDYNTVAFIDDFIRKKKPDLKHVMKNVRKYGFCKAHAMSYAQLVWQLAYEKANKPKKFWESTLKNVVSCYRNWVHYYEAKCVGVEPSIKLKQKSIYTKYKHNNINKCSNPLEQLKNYGYWNMNDDSFFKGCYSFNSGEKIIFKGLIASTRTLNYGTTRKMVIFIGVSKNTYLEIIINGSIYYDSKKVIIEGYGKKNNTIYKSIECESENILFI